MVRFISAAMTIDREISSLTRLCRELTASTAGVVGIRQGAEKGVHVIPNGLDLCADPGEVVGGDAVCLVAVAHGGRVVILEHIVGIIDHAGHPAVHVLLEIGAQIHLGLLVVLVCHYFFPPLVARLLSRRRVMS